MDWTDSTLCVTEALMNTKTIANNTVYISNLSYSRDRNGLKSLFSKFGQIKNIKIIVEPSTNQSRGMAFVEMSNPSQAKLAINGLNQKIIDGRTVKANFAIPMREISSTKTKEAETLPGKKDQNRDLEYVSKQLAKKARNDAKRKMSPLYNKELFK